MKEQMIVQIKGIIIKFVRTKGVRTMIAGKICLIKWC
jgi:hypothetical protein